MFLNSYYDSLYLYVFTGIAAWVFAHAAERSSRDAAKRIYLFISGFILFVVLGTRYEVSNDYAVYTNLFNNAEFGHYLGLTYQEPGYFLFNCLIKIFTDDARYIFIITAAITIGLIFSTFYYLRKRINLSFAVLAYICVFYYVSFCLLRISLAASLLFFAIRYIIQYKKAKFLTCLLIAFSIHYSTALWLPVLVGYYYVRKNKMKVFWAISISYFIILNSLSFLPYIGLERYQLYLDSNARSGFGLAIIFYYAPLLWLLWYLNKNKLIEHNDFAILLSMAVMQTINYYTHYIFNAAGRSYLTFTYIIIYLIPLSVKLTTGIRRNLLMFIFVLYLIISLWLRSISFYDPDGLNIFPYKSYLFVL